MVTTYPLALAQQLEFDRILEDLTKRCFGQPAKEYAEHLPLLKDATEVKRALQVAQSMLLLRRNGLMLTISDYHDTTPIFPRLALENSTLSITDLVELRNQIKMVVDWHQIFDAENQTSYPPVFELICQTEPLAETLAELERILDDEGNVRDNASEELKKIRSEIHRCEQTLHRAFDQVMEKYRRQGLLTDNLESMRNGRRVLAIPAEHKRKIAGFLLDQSTTGKTVFIQPKEAIEIEHRLFEARNDERQEINRILRTMTAQLATHLDTLKTHLEVIVQIDVLTAKSSQAMALDACLPTLSNRPGMQIQSARHPLLLLKHGGKKEHVIPFDLMLSPDQQIIVISGPNAGGKSITLKAVGLLAMMCQSGLLIPVEADSEMGIYEKILGDIGDQQSLEQDLSTYTSHLQNMRAFLVEANDRTLFLIDEFGSGTEPAIGGTIAEAILLDLQGQKAHGIITTHYGNLKILAANRRGMQNASMEFDRTALRPTYHLQIGKPGSSFAFEMAHRSGLPNSIIKRARQKIGKKEGKLEYLLTSMERDKQVLEEKLDAIKNREAKLDKLVANYERLQRELDVKRKKLKIQEKALKLQSKSEANQKLDRVIKELREKEKLAAAKKLATELKTSRKDLVQEINDLQEDIIQKTPTKSNKPLQVGDSVRMKIGGLTGTIERIRKGKATVLVGNMKLDAAIGELEHGNPQIDLNPVKSVSASFQAVKAHHKLDIRGLRRADAFQRLEKFIDQALIANLSSLEIIHGRGQGTLKQAVQDKLKEYDRDFETRHPEADQGGDGVTLVKII